MQNLIIFFFMNFDMSDNVGGCKVVTLFFNQGRYYMLKEVKAYLAK